MNYEIPLANLAVLEQRLAELNKRARRIKVAESAIETGEVFLKTVRRVNSRGVEGEPVEIQFIPVTLTGGEPVTLSGWAFVATLHHEAPGETLVALVPGEELPTAYRWASNACDHCGTSRRRNATFIVRNPEGELKQVGSGCLSDYLPRDGRDPQILARYAQWLGAFQIAVGALSEDELPRQSREEQIWDLETWMNATALLVRKSGWVSRGTANQTGQRATAAEVIRYLDPFNDEARDWAENEIGPVADQDKEAATEAIEWAEEELLDDSPDLSDYLHNLSVVVRLGYVRARHHGLAASLLAAHGFAVRKEIQRREREAKREDMKGSVHIAELKDRIRLHGVRVVFTKVMEDRGWGSSLMVKMEWNGNALVWFSSGAGPDVQAGFIIDLKGTVKKHSDFQGVKETGLNRVVWSFNEEQEDVPKKVERKEDGDWTQMGGPVASYSEGVGKGKVAFDDRKEDASAIGTLERG